MHKNSSKSNASDNHQQLKTLPGYTESFALSPTSYEDMAKDA